MSTAFIIGWVILIGSWITPSFIKDEDKKRLWGLILSSLATGIFIGATIQKYLN